MFRNKVVVRADPPNGSTIKSPFHFTQIHLDDPSASPPLHLESLCWKLSRTLPIACFLHYPSTIFLVYQTDQAAVATEAVEEIRRTASFSNVEEEEELDSPSLVVKAVECGLKSLLVNSGWRCVGESCFVYSTFATSEEKKHLMAFTVSVQSEKDGGLVFLVSPDVVRFSRFEIPSLLSSSNSENFDNGEEVDFDDYNFATSCCSLPSLSDGHAIGVRKLLPVGENLLEFEDICSTKHGMQLPNDYFIKIQLPHQGCSNTQWFPSSFVLQGAGFSPAPQSIRISKCVQVLQSFMKIMEGWNFFGTGKLKLKSVVSLTIGSELETWTETASDAQSSMTTETCSFNVKEPNNKLFTVTDSRTPKVVSICDTAGGNAEHEMIVTNLSTSKSILQLPNVPKNTLLQSSSISAHHTPASDNNSGSDKLITQGCQPSVPKKRRRSRRIITNLEKLTPSPEENITEGESQEMVKICQKRIAKGSKRNKETKVIDKKSLSEAEINTNSTGNSEDNMDAHKRIPLKQVDTNGRKKATEKEDKDDTQRETRKKSKQENSPSDIIAKVIDYHSRGELHSLTVVQMKSFLSSKHAKVGGKKQDLVERISALLI